MKRKFILIRRQNKETKFRKWKAKEIVSQELKFDQGVARKVRAHKKTPILKLKPSKKYLET